MPPPTSWSPPPRRGITLIGPLLTTATRQARAGGYTTDMFPIDWDRRKVTCPQGTASASWCEHVTSAAATRSRSSSPRPPAAPAPPAASAPPPPAGRQLGLRPRQVHEAVTAARAAQATPAWKRRYAIRAGIEGTIAQATHVTGIRRARYLGLPKTSLEHNAAAAAINLIRLDAWWTGKPLDPARTTYLQRLKLAPAA